MTFSQVLVNIVDVVIETFFISILVTIVLMFLNKGEKRCTNKKYFLILYLINLVAYLGNKGISIWLTDFSWIKSIISVLSCTIGAKIAYNSKIYKGIIASIIYLIIAAIFEIIGVLILKGLNIDPVKIVNNIYYNNLFACILSLTETLLVVFIYKFNKNLSQVDNKLKYFLPQLIAIVICLFPTMILFIFNYYKYSVVLITINLLQLLVIAFVGLYNLSFVIKHENTEMKLANTITYNETLKKVNDGVRGFKHDMGNIVQSILGYIAVNDSEGAKKYCQNLVIGFNDINVLSILSPSVINDPAIYGVVVNKILLAREKDMTLSLDINLNVSEINFPKFELSRILGILIDNAIEAGENTVDKKLILHMYHDFNNNFDKIIISNSISNTNIDLNKIFEKDYSTKENPSGFGLYEVNKFIDKNPQSLIKTSIDKEGMLFTQEITIYS